MKYIYLFIALIIVGDVYAQTAPSGYTTFLRLRKYSAGANPSADSLNANWTQLDTALANVVYDYGNQDVDGSKSFTSGGVIFQGGRLVFGNSTATSPLFVGEIVPTASRTYLTYTNTSGTDTLATQEWATAEFAAVGDFVTTTDTQTVFGVKYFYGGARFDNTLSTTSDVAYSRETIGVVSTAFSVANITFGWLVPDASYSVATINGGVDGKQITIINSDASFIVTIKDGTGNIQCAGDFAMSQFDAMTLIYNSGTSTWYELSRSNN